MNYNHLIEAYGSWIQKLLDEGREICFLTFQFHPVGGNKFVMEAEISRFYRTLLTRLIRNPRRKSQVDLLPIMIALPDRPVPKHGKIKSWADSRQNGGVHYHAVLAAHPGGWLTEPLDDHIRDNLGLYHGSHGKISDIHAKPVDRSGRLADYWFKHIKRHSFTLDDVLIFPRTASELPAREANVTDIR